MITPFRVGKVRDSYELSRDALLVVASDRISVFDVVLPQVVPGKGKVLTAMTEFWLSRFFTDIPNHLVTTDMTSGISDALREIPDLQGRGMVVRRAEMLPVEFIVRGYLYGSVMDEYREYGTASGVTLPPGLVKASKLPEPIFTPSTKAPIGQHDVNITHKDVDELIGAPVRRQAAQLCLDIYVRAAAYALKFGMIIADTKFELGWIDGVLALCDEVLTPDSSRFWELDLWEPGKEPVSFDKQPVRNHYAALGWNKKPPAPDVPPQVIGDTQARYDEVLRRLVR